MIAQLTGSVRSINSDRIILEVAGVGYLIHVTPTAAATLTLGNSLTIHTSMVVREDSMTLYGFIDAPSKETFELVQTVSGIGPRVALSILAHLSPEQLADAVESESVNILSGVPGIGKKGAQRILLELNPVAWILHLSEQLILGIGSPWGYSLRVSLLFLVSFLLSEFVNRKHRSIKKLL